MREKKKQSKYGSSEFGRETKVNGVYIYACRLSTCITLPLPNRATIFDQMDSVLSLSVVAGVYAGTSDASAVTATVIIETFQI